MRDSGSKRLAIIQSRLAPFRIPFFNRLADTLGIPPTVFVCSSASATAHSPSANSLRFHLNPLPSFSIIRRELTIQPRLPFAILRGSFDAVVAEARLGLVLNTLILLLCRMTGKRFLWWTCGWERAEMEAVTRLKRIVRGILFRMAHGGIAYSNAARDYMIRLGMKPSRVWVAQNSVDTEALIEIQSEIQKDPQNLARLRTQHGAEDKFLVLFVGKLVRTKKVDDLIQAFAFVHSHSPLAVLWIVGDGPEKTHLEKLAAEHPGLPIRFLGEITEPMQINAIYMACDVFVLPGTGGLALNQAMTFGKPIVVSSADGTEEDLVTDRENGLYFESGNTHDLAQRVLALHNDPVLRNKMGEASRNRILNSINMKNMVDAFRDAILNRPQVRS